MSLVSLRTCDGSFLSVLRPSKVARPKDERAVVPVRVIEYTLPGTQGFHSALLQRLSTLPIRP
jgi:hypothetical protein